MKEGETIKWNEKAFEGIQVGDLNKDSIPIRIDFLLSPLRFSIIFLKEELSISYLKPFDLFTPSINNRYIKKVFTNINPYKYFMHTNTSMLKYLIAGQEAF